MKQTFDVTKIVTDTQIYTRVNTGYTRANIFQPVCKPILLLQGLAIGLNMLNTIHTGLLKNLETNRDLRRNNGEEISYRASMGNHPCLPVFKLENSLQTRAVTTSVYTPLNPCVKLNQKTEVKNGFSN